MEDTTLLLQKSDIRKLLATGSGDAALCWLYLSAGGSDRQLGADLSLPEQRVENALSLLRQLGLAEDRRTFLRPSEPPRYTEADVLKKRDEPEFRELVDELQHSLGRMLSTEDLKILIGFREYLGLPDEIIPILVTYCRDRARDRGNVKAPTMRAIEKEAYYWADNNIDSFSEAQAYVQQESMRRSKLGGIRRALRINDRRLSPTEEQYILKWLEAGFGEPEIALAYDKSCVRTGGLSWPYMNSILRSWAEQHLFTVEQISQYDKAPARTYAGGKQAGGSAAPEELDPMIKKALENRRKRKEAGL